MAAERDLIDGRERSAAWKIRRSLAINPLQPAVVELYERLGGKQVLWKEPSYLDQVIERESAVDPEKSE